MHPIPGPVGSHGSLPRNGPVRILGATATPLRPVGNPGVVHGFSPVGQALSRDYPIDTRTHLPLVGVDPGATQVQPTYGILGRSTRVVPGMTAPARTVVPATRPTVTIPRPVQPGFCPANLPAGSSRCTSTHATTGRDPTGPGTRASGRSRRSKVAPPPGRQGPQSLAGRQRPVKLRHLLQRGLFGAEICSGRLAGQAWAMISAG